MANPLNVACAANAWTKVATAVTTGHVEIVKDTTHHEVTYRLTGGPAPTVAGEGTFVDEWVEIAHSAAVDVYVWANKNAGEVRVYV